MMASVDSRVRQKHVGLRTQQRRLRHLQSISACNLVLPSKFADGEVSLYFTMHLEHTSPAFYTSEKIHDKMNPKWRNFEPSCYPEHISTSSSSVVVRVWCYQTNETVALVEWTVHFSGLVYVGDQIGQLKNPKKCKHNTLLFGMFEGYFTAADCMQNNSGNSSVLLSKPLEQLNLRESYTTSSMQRIHTVQRAIKQTQVSIRRIRTCICEHLQHTQNKEQKKAQCEQLCMKISLLQEELKVQQGCLWLQREQLNKLKKANNLESCSLEEKYQTLKKDREVLQELRQAYVDTRENLLKTASKLHSRRKQQVSELADIYPIVEDDNYWIQQGKANPAKLSCLTQTIEVPGKGYTICGVHLPNSEDFTGHDETMIAVALGYVTRLVAMIAHLLDVPLRYPVKHYGSKSKIIDHITDKVTDKDREFPLYSKGKVKVQFHYGVYLLNKNIAQLRYYCGLATQDLRPTLANLLTLMELRLGIKARDQYSMGSLSLSDKSATSSKGNYTDKWKSPGQINAVTFRPALERDQRSASEPIRYEAPGTPCSLPGSELLGQTSELEEFTAVIQESETSKLPRPRTAEGLTNNNLSYSLDKGLNELESKVLVSSKPKSTKAAQVSRLPGHLQKLRKDLQLHGSEPNLSEHLMSIAVPIDIGEDDCLSSGEDSRGFCNTQLDMWTAGSSQANSEDELLLTCASTSLDGIEETTSNNITDLLPAENTPPSLMNCCPTQNQCGDYQNASLNPSEFVSSFQYQTNRTQSPKKGDQKIDKSREIKV